MPLHAQRGSCGAIFFEEIWSVADREDRFVTSRQETSEGAGESFLEADEELDGALLLIGPA
jgi:hypothetical protein